MSCNDCNSHLDSSSGGETPTPEYYIHLDGVGINGFSPTINFVNQTSSTFQIQTSDINGTSLSGQIPLMSYITDNYVTNTSLASTLANYSTTSEIASTYLTQANAATTYLKKDGSNADQGITINQAEFISLSNNAGVRIRKYNGGALQLDTTSSYLTAGGSRPLSLTGGGKSILLSDKAYYDNKQIATVDDISDATITLTQGGVTKGTFTLNGSATTIDLDAGGGAITNPLVINSDNGLKNLSIGYNSNNELTILSTWLYNGTVPIPLPAYLISSANNPISLSNTSTNHGLKTINLNYDSNTLDLNASNELTVKGMIGADGVNAGTAGIVPAPSATDNDKYLCGDGTWKAVQGGGTTYTAGYGIDIDNNTIAVDSDVVIRTSNQTISGIKQFNDQVAFPKASNQTFLSYNDNGTYTAIVRMVDSSTIKFSSGTMNGLIASGGQLELSAGSDKNIVFNANGTSKKVFYGNPNTASNEVAKLGDIPDTSDMATKTWVTSQGYTSNVGTVTSVNNTLPDAQGNVTISTTLTVIDGGNA